MVRYIEGKKISSRYSIDMRIYREYIVELIITLVVLIGETLAIVLNIDRFKIASLYELASNPVKLIVYTAYVLSIVIVPILVMLSFNAAKELVEIYRRFSLKSLSNVNVNWIRRNIWLVPVLTVLSFTSISFGIITNYRYIVLFSLMPLLPLTIVILKPIIEVYNHRRSIDIELKWFLIMLSIIEGIGTNIGFLIEKLKRAPILKSIAKEMIVIDRDSKIYFLSHIDAMLYRARATPNEKLGRIFMGYASKVREGGNVSAWLKTRIDEEILGSEFSMKLYVERMAITISQIALVIYVILPLIMVSTSMVLNIQFAIVIAVLATPFLISITYSIRPKTLDVIPIKYIVQPVIVYIVLSIILYIIIPGYSLLLSWIVGLVVGYRTYRMVKDVEGLDRDSLEILKNVIELRRSGYSIIKALEYIKQNNILDKATLRNLEIVLNRVVQGNSLAEIGAKIQSPSFLFRYVVFILGVIHECGGGDDEVLRSLYESIYRIKIMENNVKKLSLFFEILSIVNVFIMVWIWRTVSPLVMALNTYLLGDIGASSIPILILISLICFKFISSVIKRGLPIFEPRDCIAIAIGAIAVNLI
ncbi:MAG: type II secretion system F family protein [Ignisphaera sp.]